MNFFPHPSIHLVTAFSKNFAGIDCKTTPYSIYLTFSYHINLIYLIGYTVVKISFYLFNLIRGFQSIFPNSIASTWRINGILCFWGTRCLFLKDSTCCFKVRFKYLIKKNSRYKLNPIRREKLAKPKRGKILKKKFLDRVDNGSWFWQIIRWFIKATYETTRNLLLIPQLQKKTKHYKKIGISKNESHNFWVWLFIVMSSLSSLLFFLLSLFLILKINISVLYRCYVYLHAIKKI